MKYSIILTIALAAMLFSCNQSPNNEVKNAKENLTEAKSELEQAQERENEAAKAKDMAEWKAFKNEADSSLAIIENDLKKMQVRIEKARSKDEKKLEADYNKAKTDLVVFKEKLHKRNLEFEEDIRHFDRKIAEKNQSFKREFKHDMNEFGAALNDLFKDNVK